MGTTQDRQVRDFKNQRAKLEAGLAGKPPRERILLAARELFYRFGLHIVSVEAVADAALTNKMTLYRHFRSKDDLIVAYVEQLAEENAETLERLLGEASFTPQQKLAGWVDHVEDVLSNKMDRGCALSNAAVELDAGHPARAKIETYKQRKHDRLVEAFRSAGYCEPGRLADEVFLLFEGARISLQCGGSGPASRLVTVLRALLSSSPRLGASE
jgi:AcrR family transcriptional regulator